MSTYHYRYPVRLSEQHCLGKMTRAMTLAEFDLDTVPMCIIYN